MILFRNVASLAKNLCVLCVKNKRECLFAGAILAALAAGFVLCRFNPEHHLFYPRCPLFALTGLQCAGCGATRALHLLLHGDFTGAWARNPLLFIAIPFAAVCFFKPAWTRNRWFGWGVGAVVVAYTVLRNIYT